MTSVAGELRPVPGIANWRTPLVVIICGCAIALLSFGPRSSLGFFIQPMGREFAWGRDVFGLALALQNLLWGLGQPWAVSALHGRGSGDLLDAILDVVPEVLEPASPADRGPRRVALVGRPNVGKSSLLNRLAREERAVVDPVAGTTVDPVDSLVSIGGEVWQLVDTAGLRKRVGTASGTEYYASLRTNAAIDAAEVAVVMLDASEPISEQDQRIISMVIDSGRALVLAFNKWDLVDEDRRLGLDGRRQPVNKAAATETRHLVLA